MTKQKAKFSKEEVLKVTRLFLEQYPDIKKKLLKKVKSLERAEEIVADLIADGELNIEKVTDGLWLKLKSVPKF